MAILVLNAGSSNLKASVFQETNGKFSGKEPVFSDKIFWEKSDLGACKKQILALLEKIPHTINLVGHRIVHGGDKYVSTTLIDDRVMSDLYKLIELAPLHEPISIQGIECVKEKFPGIKQFAVFDTAFHSDMPESSKVFPLPYKWYQKWGIKRFGFHGISHKYATSRAATILGESVKSLNLVSCHLGNGASLCAVNEGKSIITTMGFTPLDGLVMGTRPGSIDPGIIVNLLKNKQITLEELESVLNENSGLKGICGHSDMKEVEELAQNGSVQAKLALDIYIQKLAASIAALFAYLDNRIDALIFTGGVGENSILVRAKVCHKLEFAGLKIETDLNNMVKPSWDCLVSAKQSSTKILVIHTKEDLAIAEECIGSLSASI